MSSSALPRIALFAGSTRPNRVNTTVAKFISEAITTSPAFKGVDLVPLNLVDHPLPPYDEPLPAFMAGPGKHAHEHTRQWSSTIAGFAGYVIVSPEYNYGIPGALKNAIDYLNYEWTGKPVLIVTYGVQGGSGANANLVKSLEGLKLKVVDTKITLPFDKEETPDAAAKGVLGPKTLAAWEETAKADVVKGFEELVAVLSEKKEETKEETKA